MKTLYSAVILVLLAFSASASTHIVDTLLLNDGVTAYPTGMKIYVTGPSGGNVAPSSPQTITVGAGGAVDFTLTGCQGCAFLAEYRFINARGIVTATVSERWIVPDVEATLTIRQLWGGSSAPYYLISQQQVSGEGLSAGQIWVWNGTAWAAGDPGTGGGGGGSPAGSAGDIQYKATGSTFGAATIANCTATGGFLRYNSSTHAFSCASVVANDIPTLNQNTTGTAAGLAAAYIDWNASSGGAFILNKPTLGTAAAQNVGAFAQVANNLSDLASASTARTNLGLGTSATKDHPLTLAGDLYIGGASGAPARLAGGALDTVLQGGGAGVAPSFVSLVDCGDSSHALGYSTSTHAWSCQSVTGSAGGVADPGGNGVMVRTASNTTINRTITGTSNLISVTNGDGVSGNPTLTVGSNVGRLDQGNTWATGAQDFSSATHLRVPNASGYTPTTAGHFGYDSAASAFKGYNGAVKTFAFLDSNITGTAANLSGTPALPDGTTATTQSPGDGSTKLATDAYADAAAAAAKPVFSGATADTVSSSATPAFSFAPQSNKSPTVRKFTPIVNVTAPTFTNLSAGARMLLYITTDGTHTWTWNSTISDNACNVWTASAGTTIAEIFIDPDGSTIHGGACIGGPTGLLSLVTEGATCSSSPASGTLCIWADSTDHTLKAKDSSGNTFVLPKSAGARTANQFVTHIPSTGIPSTAAIAAADLPTASLDDSLGYCADAGSNDTYACTLSPAPSGYVTGARYRFKANTANTGAATVNFNSLGAKTIVKVQGAITTTLADNDIRVGQIVVLSYDGTNMQMISQLGNAAAGASGCTASGSAGAVQASDGASGCQQATATDLSGPTFCTDAGANDTYTCSLSPTISSYVTGTHYRFKAATANTGAATINLNSVGAKTIVKVAGGITSTLADNDIRAGQWVDVVYDGTNMQMQSILGNAASSAVDPATTYTLVEDFGCGAFTSGTIGCAGWFLSASGFATGAANAIAGAPGLVTLTTSGTINSVVGISPQGTITTMAAAETYTIRLRVASITGTSASSNVRIRVGRTTQYTTPDSITNGEYLEKLEGDTNWFCVVNGAGGNSRTDTGVAFSTSAFAVQIRRIDSTHIGCKVATKLSTLAAATEASSAATEPTTDMVPFIMVKNTAAEVKLLNLDYWDMTITGLDR